MIRKSLFQNMVPPRVHRWLLPHEARVGVGSPVGEGIRLGVGGWTLGYMIGQLVLELKKQYFQVKLL